MSLYGWINNKERYNNSGMFGTSLDFSRTEMSLTTARHLTSTFALMLVICKVEFNFKKNSHEMDGWGTLKTYISLIVLERAHFSFLFLWEYECTDLSTSGKDRKCSFGFNVVNELFQFHLEIINMQNKLIHSPHCFYELTKTLFVVLWVIERHIINKCIIIRSANYCPYVWMQSHKNTE